MKFRLIIFILPFTLSLLFINKSQSDDFNNNRADLPFKNYENIKFDELSMLPEYSVDDLSKFSETELMFVRSATRSNFNKYQGGNNFAYARNTHLKGQYFDYSNDKTINDTNFRLKNTNQYGKNIKYNVASLDPGNFAGAFYIIKANLKDYKTLTFVVKGKKGGEKFNIGATDIAMNAREDSVMAGPIDRYLSKGVTTNWQVVKVPLKDFTGINLNTFFSIIFDFKTLGIGEFYIDELRLTKEEVELPGLGESLLLDNFNFDKQNSLGRVTNVFKARPGFIKAKKFYESQRPNNRVLKLDYSGGTEKEGLRWVLLPSQLI